MKELSGPISLIKRGIKIFFDKKNLPFFLKIYALLLPFAIFSIFQTSYASKNADQLQNLWFVITVAVVNFLYVLIYIWVSAAGIEGMRRAVAGESLILRDTLNVGWKKYWKFFLTGLALFLIDLIGFVLLIIPGIIFVVWFVFSRFIIIEEPVGIRDALTKSKDLVKGNFWKIFGRLIVFGLFGILVQIIVSIVPYVGSALASLFGILFILPSYLLYEELVALKELKG